MSLKHEPTMTPRDFCYWLQGFFELNNPEKLDEQQTILVKKHLYNVFQHDCEKIKDIELNLDNFQFTRPPSVLYPEGTIFGSC